MNPDVVYTDISFDTLIACAYQTKERNEFRERFESVWKQLNDGNNRT